MSIHIEKFLHACAHDNAASVIRMLDAGINVDTEMPDSRSTGLLRAVLAGNKETLAVLLGRGADVNYKNQPLYYAALMGRAEICTALTMAGADTQIADSSGNTPLHVATELGWLEACKALLNAGSDVHQTNDMGKSALELAKEADGKLEEAFHESDHAWTLTHAAIARARPK